MALLNIFRGTQVEVSERPVSDGALLFATDTKKIYLDKDSSRIEMSSVQDLSDYVTTSELEELLATKADATHTHADATGDASGFMSSADKTKLDGLVGFPDGGTDGQILTKTADGEEWADAPEPDLSDYVKLDGLYLLDYQGSPVTDVMFGVSGSPFTQISDGAIRVSGQSGTLFMVDAGGGSISVGSKSVSSITDDASGGAADALATAKAVKDYVDANGGTSIDLPLSISQGGTGVTTEDALIQLVFNSTSTPQASDTQYGVVKFASDEDFKAYMGIS